MTTAPKPLNFEVLIGCAWVAIHCEHVRKNDVFRLLRKDGSAYLAAARVLDVDDCGIYVARQDGTEAGVEFEAIQPVTVLVAPALDYGD